MYLNQEAEAIHQAGLEAARQGDLEGAHRKLDETLRFLEADFDHDTSFLRAGVMCNLAMILILRGRMSSGQQRDGYFQGAFHTLVHANATSTDQLTRHFQPYVGYVGISATYQATVHLQVCATHINMGLFYSDQAEARETERIGSGAGSRRAAEDSRWLARHHLDLAREADPAVSADVEQSLAGFLIDIAQADFFNAPEAERATA